jgi:amino acid transporter
MAISEIATNKRVEGGGEYFIISRSFGLNIGATIGIALYLSQAISVAFYVIAFTEAFDFLFKYVYNDYGIYLPRQAISIPALLVLGLIILKKGANLGVKALYFVVAILGVSLILFFLGSTEHADQSSFNFANAEMRNMDSFFLVFAIIFPAFTGMTAGVGLSGDLKDPSKSIPLGTTAATFAGIIIYIFIAYKLSLSASADTLINDQFVMGKVAIWGMVVIPIGLAASTISSALGSVMVAPRTLQALANDNSLPVQGANKWLAKGRAQDNEPINASLVTVMIALIFVAFGNVDVVAEIISMFFMITYGSLCLISFLNHFGSSPSYRPSFKSKWFLSLIGFVSAIIIMFKINSFYTIIALALMISLYIYIESFHKSRKGLSSLFANTIFQINRTLQLYLQRKKVVNSHDEWRPSAICISKNSFVRDNAFRLLKWISYKYGFGTYLHRINGYYSKKTKIEADEIQKKLIKNMTDDNFVYIDTIISPSYTTAIAQAIQIPGIAGMENNMVIFEYDKENPSEELADIIDNFNLVSAGSFDFAILAASRKPLIYKNGIHVWIKTSDEENSNLMILLSFIIQGHPDWKKAKIRVFHICKESEVTEAKRKMDELVLSGRLPITNMNIEIIIQKEDVSPKSIINEKSADAGLVILGFREESMKHQKNELFEGYDQLGEMLFINSFNKKSIE